MDKQSNSPDNRNTSTNCKITISPEWTHEEKLKVIIIMTDSIRDDINAGRYSKPGRPNIQAVHELIMAGPAELETYSADVEGMINEFYDCHNANKSEWNLIKVP